MFIKDCNLCSNYYISIQLFKIEFLDLMSNLRTNFVERLENSCDSNNDENLKFSRRCKKRKKMINVQRISQKNICISIKINSLSSLLLPSNTLQIPLNFCDRYRSCVKSYKCIIKDSKKMEKST